MPQIDSHIKLSGYIFPFLVGGLTVAGVKYISTISTPAIAALIGAIPVGYLSIYFVSGRDKRENYLENYAFSNAFTIMGVISYIIMLNMKIDRNIALILALILIATVTIIKVIYFPTNLTHPSKTTIDNNRQQ